MSLKKIPSRFKGKKKAYILSFDRDNHVNYMEFHKTLVGLPEILTWWHYIKSCYILISRSSATQLNKEIVKIAPEKRFLIVELNLINRNGWLPQEAWEWIKEQQEEIEPTTPPDLKF